MRRIELAGSGLPDETERDAVRVDSKLPVSAETMALVLVDVWSSHRNAGFFQRTERVLESRLLPLVEGCRSAGVTVIHTPTTRDIHPRLHPLGSDLVIQRPRDARRGDDVELDRACRKRGIDTLLYAGWASNMCLLNKPANLRTMRTRYDYTVVLVRDASVAVESPESLDGEWFHHWAVFEVERKYGYSTRVDDVMRALRRSDELD